MKRRAVLGALASTLVVAGTTVALTGATGVVASNAAPTPIYQNSNYSFAERAADLVAHFTPAQLGSQGNSSQAPAIPALGVTTYGWWNESLHGVARYTVTNNANAVTTTNDVVYPDDNSLGSTWDPNLIYNVGMAIGQEARDSAPSNVLDMDYYAPTMNLARDPRWGRNDEIYSEDPFEDSQIVDQYVDGMQGEDQNGNLLASGNGYYQAINTIKHYTAYNSEVNRTNGNDPMDQRTLLEYDTMPFRSIVEQAHPGSVMTSYPEVNGVPSPASYYLMDTLLRQTFGFSGYVTGDCDTTFEITSGHAWQPLDYPRKINVLERSAFAQAAGNDLTCDKGFADSNNYGTSLPTDMTSGVVTEEDLGFAGGSPSAINNVDTYTANDAQVSDTRLFTARMSLGEFDNPLNVPYIQAAKTRLVADGVTGPYDTGASNSLAFSNNNNAALETPARLALARQAGDEAIVLLKNANNTLPLHVPTTGTYNVAVVGEPAHPWTFSNTTHACTQNISAMYDGDYASTQGAAGLAKATDAYTGIQSAITAINPNATVTFINGYNCTAAPVAGLTTVDTTNPPDANSINNLTTGGPWNAVVVMGATDSGTGTEGVDRTALTLPGAQNTLIQDVYNILGPNVPEIVYTETLGPLDVNTFDDDTPYDSTDVPAAGAVSPAAVLWSGYNAQTQGQSLADVLLGAYNPSGRLNETWVHDVSDLAPITDYDIRPNGPDAPGGAAEPGRTYQYYNGPISYPFGYGLSYSTYTDTNLQVNGTAGSTAANPVNVGANDTVQVTVTAHNTSATTAGNDLVELYVNQPNAPAALQRPIKRLEGFQLVNLAAGGSQTVTFNIKVPSLAFFNTTDQRWEVDPGLYGIEVSTSAADQDIQQEGYINVSGTETPTLNVVTTKPVMQGDQARDIQQRVMYPIGATVQPDLTASMSDDTLYGNIEYGASKACPSGMTVTYSTDQPTVVSVPSGAQTCTGGTITTLSNGAATVTANVTYQGVTKSTSFVVRVLSYLSGITINGNALAGFQPDAFNYDMTLAPGTAAPTVAATDPDSGATVSIAQATAVPGTATITDTGSDGIVETYTVNFAYGAQSDPFSSSTLGSQWSIIRADPTHYSLTANPGSLTLTPEQGTLAGTTNSAKNVFVQPELGNWTITTKATFSALPALAGQQAGLIAYGNDDNYLEFGVLDGAPDELAVTHEDNLDTGVGGAAASPQTIVLATVATSTIPALTGTGAKTVWLRMSKTGPYYTESYSTDGVNFTNVYTSGESITNDKVGVYAINGTSATTTTNTVAFDTFATTNATTTASFSPPASNGFFKGNETVTLSATDPNGPGILSTSYSIDGGPTQTYTGPFPITGEGSHTLTYYSTDNAFNVEPANTQTVNIDETPPVTTAVINGVTVPYNATTFTATAPATVSLSAVDPSAGSPAPTSSGVNQTFYSINGGAPILYSGPFVLDPQNGNTDTGGAITFKYWSTDKAGNIEDPTITLVLEPTLTTTVTSNVPSTLAISVGATAPSFGTFVPGLASTYTASVGATITTTAQSSTLMASDGSSTFPGHLVNTSTGGPYQLPSGLQVNATSSNAAASGGSFFDLSSVNPATILSYSAPVSNDPVTVGFKQVIGATDPLRTGTYSKTITLTLSTNTP